MDEEQGQKTASEVDGIFVGTDVGDRLAITRLREEVDGRLGGIDILVNNAGIISRTPFLELTEEEWDRVLRVDLTSLFLLSKAFVPSMCKRHDGCVINISSLSEQLGVGFVGRFAYATAKAGVSGLTRAMAKELAGFGVRVNAIAPGVMDTEMTRFLEEENVLDNVVGSIPLGRRGEPRDVANTALFLASSMSSYMTGQVLNVDGGVRMK
jgi:3-oxoacyl-[acyl-carrier protein] reductase